MNNEDMSEMIQKITSMMNSSMKENDKSENEINKKQNSNDVSSVLDSLDENAISNLLSQLNIGDKQSSSQNQNNKSNQFDFDINTILKIKNMIDKMNTTKNDPRSNLLLSLKPYLNHHRQEKLDQYMQFLSVSKVIEALGSEKENLH